MKQLIFAVLILFSVHSVAQDIKGFSIENKKVVWQKVFDSDLSKADIIKALQGAGVIAEVSTLDESILADLKQTRIDIDVQGVKKSSVPIYLRFTDIEGSCSIDFKQGRYRVTIKNLILIDEDDRTPLEFFAVKKGLAFKNGFYNRDHLILESNFNRLFTIQEPDDDWD